MTPGPAPGKTPRAVWNALSEQRVFSGAGRIAIGIDGRSGSGKSTLARDMAAELSGRGAGARIVQLDQLCPGWHGLDRAVDLAASWILEPRDANPAGVGYWRWDWHRSRYAEWVSVAPADCPSTVLIIEGCGIGSARTRRLLDFLIWVETPEPVRKRRALVRECEFLESAGVGPASPPDPELLWWWPIWAAQEAQIIAAERIASRADVVVSGSAKTTRERPRRANNAIGPR